MFEKGSHAAMSMELRTQGDAWHLKPGDKIKRTDLHAIYGGGGQGGIEPSRKTNNVLIFTDRASGAKHGYIDDWQSDGLFHYTGEGQRGDQKLTSKGNAAVLRHKGAERSLRVFEGVGGTVTYYDEFILADDKPFYRTDAPETGGGPIRSVIVFRLKPRSITPSPVKSSISIPSKPIVEATSVEERHTEKFYVDPVREPYEAERREAKLVLAFKSFLETQCHQVLRKMIQTIGEAKPLFTDLFVEDLNLLVEAKGTVSREAFRMALGQLADYRRFLNKPACAILLPTPPSDDLRALANAEGIQVWWAVSDGFAKS